MPPLYADCYAPLFSPRRHAVCRHTLRFDVACLLISRAAACLFSLLICDCRHSFTQMFRCRAMICDIAMPPRYAACCRSATLIFTAAIFHNIYAAFMSFAAAIYCRRR